MQRQARDQEQEDHQIDVDVQTAASPGYGHVTDAGRDQEQAPYA